MVEQAYDIIMNELKPALEKKGLKSTNSKDGEVFANEEIAVKIRYEADSSQFKLVCSEVNDGEFGDFYTKSTWLFDDGSDERRARSIGIDFKETLGEILGIKKTHAATSGGIAMPERAGKNDTVNLEGFTNRTLALFPKYKDDYKAHVAKYGELLHCNFFKSTLAVEVREAIHSNDRKQTTKIFKMLKEMYTNGNCEVDRTITYSILAEAAKGNNKVLEEILRQVEDDKHMYVMTKEVAKRYAKA